LSADWWLEHRDALFVSEFWSGAVVKDDLSPPLLSDNSSTGLMPARVPAGTAGSGVGPSAPASEIKMYDARKVWASLRRRWLTATSLGLVGSLLAATSAFLLIPTYYTAMAELHVRPASGPYGADAAAKDLATYKQSVIRMATSPAILKSILRGGTLAKTKLSAKPDPVLALETRLRCTSPALEYLAI